MASPPALEALLHYRGGVGQAAYLFHRISGVAVWAFVVLHVVDIYLVGGDPALYDELLSFYASPVGRLLEVLLGAALMYHALNGMRIIVMDLWPPLARYHRQLWWICWALFLLVGLPVTWIIVKPIFGL